MRWWAPALMLLAILLPAIALGQEIPEVPAVDEVPSPPTLDTMMEDIAQQDEPEVSAAIRLVVLFTVLSFLPGILLLMTPFTRYIIVFSLLRQALGLQQSPPNQVLIGFSLILALVVMRPTLAEVNEDSLQPYLAGEMTTVEAYEAGIAPMRRHMLANIGRTEMATSVRIARLERPETVEEIPTPVIVTAYVLSELHTAFVTAVKVYLPFLVVDLIVASVLLGMGMMMLPPVVVSLPFKLLVFVLMDGWNLLVTGMTGAMR